jgi:hypothetical protein
MAFNVFSACFLIMSALVFLARYAYCGCEVQKESNSLYCNGFQSWSDLNKMINNSLNPSATIINNAYIQPNTPIVLSSELDIASLFTTLNISGDAYFAFNMRNLSGIDVVAWPSGVTRVQIEIDESRIEFFMNGKPLSEYTCSVGMMIPFLKSSNNASFFNLFSEITFFTQNQYSSQPVCPYIFAYAKLDVLTINEQTDSNRWRFQSFGINESTTTIYSDIGILSLHGFGCKLDESFMNPLVFESVHDLGIYNSISSIQPDLFKFFEKLSDLSFQLDDLENFFGRVGINWTMSLNTDLNSIKVVFYEQNASNRYMYPDKDFCLFANFPTQRHIIPVIDSVYLTNCTSTIRWLFTYYFSHDMESLFDEYGDAKSLFFACGLAWNQTLINDPTYFEKKIVSQCHLTITTTSSMPYTTNTTSLTFSNSTNGCSLSKFCTQVGWCENFTNLVELNSTLLAIDSSCYNYFHLNSSLFNNGIFIKANKYRGPLNDRFNYELFLKQVFPQMPDIDLAFLGFNGLDFNFSSVFKSHPLIKPKRLSFYFVFPEFNFYANGESVVMNSSCDESELVKSLNKGIFSAASSLTVNLESKSPDSSFTKWCPMIFKNVKLDTISTIGKPLRFSQESDAQSDVEIYDANFENLVVNYLDGDILNSQTYSKVNYFYIGGTVKNIQKDVFKELKGVKNIGLEIYNLKGFIHGNGLEWMNYINYYATPSNSSPLEIRCDKNCLKTLKSLIVVVRIINLFTEKLPFFPADFFPNVNPYAFPDADFCYFANYPHNRSILTKIEFDLSNCTCTIAWLYKNLVLLTNYSTIEHELLTSLGNACMVLINDSVRYKHTFTACDFSNRIYNCSLNSTKLNNSIADYQDKYFYFYGIQSNLKKAQQVLNNYFDTWVLFLGLLANLTTAILIINARSKIDRYKNKKENQLGGIEELFFTYMLVNALINLIYCLMMFFIKYFHVNLLRMGNCIKLTIV